MGSGKSHWGKIWAGAHNKSFVDLDEVIELKEGKSIADIFELKGETYFREIETLALKSCYNLHDTVIACGGGTPCFFDNMQWMNTNGNTIYIKCTVTEILDRVLSEKEKRPLLKKLNQGELLFFIEQKLKEREVFYSQAKLIVQSSDLTANHFSSHIIPAFK